MTEEELREIGKIKPIRPELASKFLKPTFNIAPHAIRMWSQQGECPFCQYVKYSKRACYFVHVENLIKFKKGELL